MLNKKSYYYSDAIKREKRFFKEKEQYFEKLIKENKIKRNSNFFKYQKLLQRIDLKNNLGSLNRKIYLRKKNQDDKEFFENRKKFKNKFLNLNNVVQYDNPYSNEYAIKLLSENNNLNMKKKIEKQRKNFKENLEKIRNGIFN